MGIGGTSPLRPGALFVAGDPKQSTYRFRRADVDIYNIVRQRFSDPAVGRLVPLTLNFRSAPQLCDWANEVFHTRPVEIFRKSVGACTKSIGESYLHCGNVLGFHSPARPEKVTSIWLLILSRSWARS
jgi:ATP-dependent exoDNAse (exonuclease V) beta subunit